MAAPSSTYYSVGPWPFYGNGSNSTLSNRVHNVPAGLGFSNPGKVTIGGKGFVFTITTPYGTRTIRTPRKSSVKGAFCGLSYTVRDHINSNAEARDGGGVNFLPPYIAYSWKAYTLDKAGLEAAGLGMVFGPI